MNGLVSSLVSKNDVAVSVAEILYPFKYPVNLHRQYRVTL